MEGKEDRREEEKLLTQGDEKARLNPFEQTKSLLILSNWNGLRGVETVGVRMNDGEESEVRGKERGVTPDIFFFLKQWWIYGVS